MKDMFEEQLKAKLEELESDPEVAGMLSSGAIWDKISRAQNPLPQKRLWLPRMAKIAAALVICSGIALLLRPRQESTSLYWSRRRIFLLQPVCRLPYGRSRQLPAAKKRLHRPARYSPYRRTGMLRNGYRILSMSLSYPKYRSPRR